MNSKIGIFLCAIFVLKAITSIQADQQLSYEHDVTKQTDEWITRVLKLNTDAFKKLLGRVMNKELDPYTHTMKEEMPHLGKTLTLKRTNMSISEFKNPQLNWKFSANKMSFFLREFTVRFTGYVAGSEDDYASFDTFLDMENVTFTFTSNEDKVTTELTYEKNWLWFHETDEVEWTFHTGPSKNQIKTLSNELGLALPDWLRHTYVNSKEFATSLRSIFNVYFATKSKIIQTHSDFFTNKDDKYYYLIPKIPYFSFNLKNVFVKGIWNLEWMKINSGVSIFTHTLMVRDVQGNFLLDFGEKPENPVKLSFKIDYLSLSADRKTINVDARCYSVNKTNTPLSYRQSSLIMQRIESTIASSIFPTLTYRQTYDIDSPLDTFKTENVDWNEVKKQFHEWIPFSDDPKSPSPPAPSPPPPPSPAAAAQTKNVRGSLA